MMTAVLGRKVLKVLQGPPGPGATPTPESCGTCHGDIAGTHALTDIATVADVEAVEGSLVITFSVAVDGMADDSFTLRRAYVHYSDPANPELDGSEITDFTRDTICSGGAACAASADIDFSSDGGGDYTVTIDDAVVVDDATYLVQLESATSSERPVIIVRWGTAYLRDLVSNAGCANCHGPYPAWSEKFSHYAVGGSECQICHSQGRGRSISIISKNAAGGFVEQGPIYGTNLVEYIHGIHNSHNMPDGVYYRTTAADDAFDEEDRYSVGFPSAMNNCAVCHTTTAQLAAAAAAPVSYYLCMSCHNNWDGFVDHEGNQVIAEGGPLAFHRNYSFTVDCMSSSCHGALPTRNEAADFHDFFESADRHLDSFYRGADISYTNPNDVGFAITGVTKTGNNVTFTWTASRNGAAVDPCNTDTATGPVFTDLGAYLAYAKGDDWVNEFISTTPGQPASAKNLFTSLATTCADNVATTTGLSVDPAATYAEKVLLAIGGKPVDRHATGNDFYVRFPSPTYAFSMATGAAVAARRDAVATERCLTCHQGTLYQHGGDRVDNEQLCVICHNPASNDKNNRKDRFQIVNADGTVNTDATYDGLTAQTYDMRTMIHAIHGVSKRDKPIVIYRSRGIYSFVTPDTEEPTGWPADGMTIYGSLNDSTIAHNWTVVHYPRPVNYCEACHNPGAYEVPDQTKAVAVTQDAGDDYADQSDDRVIGPTAAACINCHWSTSVRAHAKTFGYDAEVTKDEMLELSK